MAATLGQIRDRIIELVEADDLDGPQKYVQREIFFMYSIEPTDNLARDLLGLIWALVKGKGWHGPYPKRTPEP